MCYTCDVENVATNRHSAKVGLGLQCFHDWHINVDFVKTKLKLVLSMIQKIENGFQRAKRNTQRDHLRPDLFQHQAFQGL